VLSAVPMADVRLSAICYNVNPGVGVPEDSAASPGGAETLCHQVISRAPSAGMSDRSVPDRVGRDLGDADRARAADRPETLHRAAYRATRNQPQDPVRTATTIRTHWAG